MKFSRFQGKGSNWNIFPKQYIFIPKEPPIFYNGNDDLLLKSPLTAKCTTFNTSILSCYTWNLPKKCPSWIYKQWIFNWHTSWECFVYDNSELRYWNFYNGSQWGFHFAPSLTMVSDLFQSWFWDFGNKSQIDPSHRFSVCYMAASCRKDRSIAYFRGKDELLICALHHDLCT